MVASMRPVLFLLATALPALAVAQDLENGKDVNGTCAACHGAEGQGGKMGEYPRLAGQRAEYLAQQLRRFKGRKRINIPMFPYTEPRELPEKDIADISAFLSRIELPTKAPEFKESASALEKLRAMEHVLIVPRVEGDVAHGQALYAKRCARCHGERARGRRMFPSLVGQYPAYLERQLANVLKGTRLHVSDDGKDDVLARLSPKDFTDVLAWLTAIQTGEVTAAP